LQVRRGPFLNEGVDAARDSAEDAFLHPTTEFRSKAAGIFKAEACSDLAGTPGPFGIGAHELQCPVPAALRDEAGYLAHGDVDADDGRCGDVEFARWGSVAGDRALDLAGSDARPASREQVVQDGLSDPAGSYCLSWVDQHAVGGDDLVPGGFQRDSERGAVGVDPRRRFHGFGHGTAKCLVPAPVVTVMRSATPLIRVR
jgi:hypothetical protein